MQIKRDTGSIRTKAVCLISSIVLSGLFLAASTVVACPIDFNRKKNDDSGMQELKPAPCSSCSRGLALEKESDGHAHNQDGQNGVGSVVQKNSIETPSTAGGL